MSLDLTPGHGNLLGEYEWETLSPWLGGSWTLNTGVSPREGRVSSLSAILEDSPHQKYYLSRKACLGILRRARERGKPLPPHLEAALKAQAGLTVYVTPIPGTAPVTVFAATQNDGAPMRAQRSGSHGERSRSEMSELPPTGGSEGYGACGDAVADCLNPWDTQQARITAPEGVSPTINSGEAKPGGRVFAAGFCAGAGPSAGGIGYHEELAPTLKAAPSGNMMPSVLCLTDHGGQRMDLTQNMTPTLRAQMGAHLPLICLNDQGGGVMSCSENIAGTLRAQEHGHQPLVFENHGIAARYTGPHKVALTLSARAGTGGNNLPLVAQEEPQVFCITGNAIDRQPENGGNGLGVQEDIAYTLTATDHHAVFARQRCDKFQEGGVASTQSSRQQKEATDLIYQETVGTFTSSDSKGPNAQYVSQDKLIVEAPLLIRRLTPRECERLQGYPDDWTALPGAADSPRYRALGNSVAIPCVEFLMHGMALVLRAG
nr:DNA cytosine methyltransferase [uncultured Oscillibacter sp.]